MNEEVQKQLLEWAKSAAVIANEQVPQLAEEYLRWSMYSNAVSTATCFVFTVAAVCLVRLSSKKINQGKDEYIPGVVFGCISGFVFSMIFLDSLHDLIKVIAAPKLYLLDYLVRISR